jgi:hypothetical protein
MNQRLDSILHDILKLDLSRDHLARLDGTYGIC